MEELRREMLELRQQLDKERSARMQMEEQVRKLEEVLCGQRPLSGGHGGHYLSTSRFNISRC